MMNPGGLVPIPILDDARKPAIYFSPKPPPSRLERRGQVQPQTQAAGWQQTLMGWPTPLLFRLTQTVDGNIQREAEEELCLSRELGDAGSAFRVAVEPTGAAVLARCRSHIGNPERQAGQRLWARIAVRSLAPPADTNLSALFAFGRLMAHSDPTQALHDFTPMLASENMTLRRLRRPPWALLQTTGTGPAAAASADQAHSVKEAIGCPPNLYSNPIFSGRDPK